MRVRNNSTLHSIFILLQKRNFYNEKIKAGKNNCRLFCLRFVFAVENKFSCKEIPHIYQYGGKALANDIVLVNGDKLTENGISDKKA